MVVEVEAEPSPIRQPYSQVAWEETNSRLVLP
jgi:hypothetical protein